MNNNQIEQTYALHWNMNGFYNKYHDIQIIVNKYNPSIFAMNETKHDKNIKLRFSGYEIYEKSTENINNHAHGGVAIMIKNNFPHKQINLNTSLQAVAVQVYFPFKCTIVSIYIPPHTKPAQAEMTDLVNQLQKPFLIMGDMNGRHTSLNSLYTNTLGRLVMKFVDEHDLIIINDDTVTRVGAHGESSTIDLVIISSDLANIFEVETSEDFHGSDHKLVAVNTLRKLFETRQLNFNYKKANWESFAREVKLNEIDINDDIEKTNENIISHIKNAAEHAIPKFCARFNSEKCKSWWTKQIDTEHKEQKRLERKIKKVIYIRNLNDAARKIYQNNFKKQRSSVRKLIQESKKRESEFFCRNIKEDTSNAAIWKKVKANEGKRSKAKTILIYDENSDECITNKKVIAEKISASFQENFKNDVILEINENVEPVIKIEDAKYLNLDFTIDEMLRVIQKAKNTAPGKDEISYAMIKNLNMSDKIYLLEFYNKTWHCGNSPKKWKESLMIPLPKDTSDKQNIKNYRPIQLISVLSKIKENMAAYRLNYHMEIHNLTHKMQSGFRAKRSIHDNLLILENRIRSALNRKQEVIAIFFDIQKAFDSVKSERIIECLKEMGIHENLLEYSKDFFKERKFQVKFENEISESRSQENGVPQGSGLSVQFFKIVMDKMKEFIDSEDILIYVDDFVYLKVLKNGEDKTVEIQNDVKKINNWAKHFGMQISKQKTKIMKFTNKLKPTNAPKIKIENNEIEEVKTFKFLGVTFEKNLKYNQYVNELAKRLESDLNVIKYLCSEKMNISRETLIHVLNAKVRSKIEFANLLMHNESKQRKKKLRVKYNNGLRMCLGAFRTCNLQCLFSEAGEMSFENREKTKSLKYAINVLANQEHPLREEILETVSEIDKKYKHKKKKESRILESCRMLSKLNIKNIISTKPFFNRPSWITPRIFVDKSLHIHKKDTLNSETWKKLYKEKSEEYENDVKYFTDGSKINDKVAWAVTSEESEIKSGRLEDNATILTAEIKAIAEAAKIKDNKKKVIIMTDSLSTIEMIENKNEKNNNCRYLMNILNREKKKIILMWIPSHKGIKGNEMADECAKNAINKEKQNEMTENDSKLYIENIIKEKENKKWLKIDKKKTLRKLKEDTKRLNFPSELNRKDQKIITRLRTGYTRYTEEWKFKKNHYCRRCETCKVEVTVEHLLIDCKETEQHRKNLDIKFEDLKNPKKFKNIIEFIKNIKLYDKI